MILLDTHALIWWVSDPKRVGAKARRAIDTAVESRQTLSVSSISMWEVAMLSAHGRLELTHDVMSWLMHVESLPFFSFVPVDNHVAVRAVQLENFPHRDPADRIIASTALSLGATLVTADERLRSYKPLKCVWN